MDKLIPARRQEQVLMSKKEITCLLVGFAIQVDYREKIKVSGKIDEYWDLARELKNVEHKGDGDTNYSCCTWNGLKDLEKTGRMGNEMKNRDHPDNCIV